MSQLAQFFERKQFCILVEYLCHQPVSHTIATKLAGFNVVITLADRVHSDTDTAPLMMAQMYPKHIEKILHYAGKGRDIRDFEDFLNQTEQAAYHNLLLLTGDKLKQHQYGNDDGIRTRYLESVNAVLAAKQRKGFYVGVAFNPFKYAKAEKQAQYFKLHKKIKAGADYIITQLGYDLFALKEVQDFLKQNNYTQNLVACVMPLTLARAKFMLKHQVAGIVISQQMLKHLEQEQTLGQNDNVYRRCAIQILLCQHFGFAGVHLSACHHPQEQAKLEFYIQQYRQLSLIECENTWQQLWGVTDNGFFQPSQAVNPIISQQQIFKYKQLHLMHDVLFNSRIAKGWGKLVFRSKFWQQPNANKRLVQAEFLTKHNVVGCESCGQCRLADTLYICPETCPKGLANGPCGGTTLDRCEFGDRECIHSVKARLAHAVKNTHILKEKIIATVPCEVRGSSSWKNWFLDTKL